MATSLDEKLAKEAPVAGPALLYDVYKVLDNLDQVLQDVPGRVIRESAGLCFLITRKAGAVITGIKTTGFIIARLPEQLTAPQKWSAPCALTGGGMGLGLEVGASETYHLYTFDDRDTIERFASGQVEMGASTSLTAGSSGEEVSSKMHVGSKGVAYTHAYSYAKGALLGASVTTEVLRVDREANREFFEDEYEPKYILGGQVGGRVSEQRPHLAQLYKRLEEAGDRPEVPRGDAPAEEATKGLGGDVTAAGEEEELPYNVEGPHKLPLVEELAATAPRDMTMPAKDSVEQDVEGEKLVEATIG
eukprot:jgi/Mesvir1/25731/Mv01915-RA.1